MTIRLGAIVLAASFLTGCESNIRQEIRVNDPRVTRVIIADPNEVARNCHGDQDDHGRPRVGREEVGGCYHPPFGPIWISWAHDVGQTLRHEVCHAISGLPPAECDNLYPMAVFNSGSYVPFK